MLKDFKKFILRGNVVDLAVGIAIGAAFSAIVTALVKDLITPIVAAIFGKPDFSGLKYTINGSEFLYGDFINQVISFVLIASAVFFVVVQPVNKLTEIANRNKTPEDPTEKKCEHCLSKIPREAKVCAFCTKNVK